MIIARKLFKNEIKSTTLKEHRKKVNMLKDCRVKKYTVLEKLANI